MTRRGYSARFIECIAEPEDPKKLRSLVLYWNLVAEDGKPKPYYQVWTADAVAAELGGELLYARANPYGEIPFAFTYASWRESASECRCSRESC